MRFDCLQIYSALDLDLDLIRSKFNKVYLSIWAHIYVQIQIKPGIVLSDCKKTKQKKNHPI